MKPSTLGRTSEADGVGDEVEADLTDAHRVGHEDLVAPSAKRLELLANNELELDVLGSTLSCKGRNPDAR